MSHAPYASLLATLDKTGLAALHPAAEVELNALARELGGIVWEEDDEAPPGRTLELEQWLGALLLGPHDSEYFQRRHTWARGVLAEGTPAARLAKVVSRLRARLMELISSFVVGDARADGARCAVNLILDAEIAAIVETLAEAQRGVAAEAEAAARGALEQLRERLSVIESSAYLLQRHSQKPGGDAERGAAHARRIFEAIRDSDEMMCRLVETLRAMSVKH